MYMVDLGWVWGRLGRSWAALGSGWGALGGGGARLGRRMGAEPGFGAHPRGPFRVLLGDGTVPYFRVRDFGSAIPSAVLLAVAAARKLGDAK